MARVKQLRKANRDIGIHVRVTAEEKAKLDAKASSASITVAAFLRSAGLGRRIDSRLDLKAIHELGKLAADFGRVGGLLKMWLSDDHINQLAQQIGVPDLVKQIEADKRTILSKIAELHDLGLQEKSRRRDERKGRER